MGLITVYVSRRTHGHRGAAISFMDQSIGFPEDGQPQGLHKTLGAIISVILEYMQNTQVRDLHTDPEGGNPLYKPYGCVRPQRI